MYRLVRYVLPLAMQNSLLEQTPGTFKHFFHDGGAVPDSRMTYGPIEALTTSLALTLQ